VLALLNVAALLADRRLSHPGAAASPASAA